MVIFADGFFVGLPHYIVSGGNSNDNPQRLILCVNVRSCDLTVQQLMVNDNSYPYA